MPHIDGHGDMDAGTDYSDFEYQHTRTAVELNADQSVDSNPRSTYLFEYDPLAGLGGLANNEVAELVYQEVIAGVEVDTETGDQSAASAFQMRGGFGINLDPVSVDQVVPGSFGGPSPGTNSRVLEETDSAISSTIEGSYTADELLQQYEVNGVIPFSGEIADISSGAGGAGAIDVMSHEKNWRELTGRGPVVNNDDELINIVSVNADNTVVDVNGFVRTHLVWDVAETSDAGRKFSVPMDD